MSDIFKLLDDAIKQQDRRRAMYGPPRIYMSERMYNFVQEHPEEFKEAYMQGVKEICEASGLLD